MAKHKKPEIIKKESLYRGKTIEYLKTLDVREASKFFKSRGRRYIIRNFDLVEKFIKRCERNQSKNKRIKTHLRDLIIVPKLVGLTIGVHNGKVFQDTTILPDMIGHKLGEFAMTRGKVSHGTAGIGATKSSRAQKK